MIRQRYKIERNLFAISTVANYARSRVELLCWLSTDSDSFFHEVRSLKNLYPRGGADKIILNRNIGSCIKLIWNWAEWFGTRISYTGSKKGSKVVNFSFFLFWEITYVDICIIFLNSLNRIFAFPFMMVLEWSLGRPYM